MAGEGVLSRVEFEHMRTAPFLRAGAWLDASGQGLSLMSQLDADAACCVSPDLVGRPFFAASIEAYDVLASDSMGTRIMWAHHTEGFSCIYNARLERVVQLVGSKGATAEAGWLETQRVQRHHAPPRRQDSA